MNYLESGYMIAWRLWGAESPRIEVGPWPESESARWSHGYTFTTGHCDLAFRKMSERDQAQALLNLAASLMFQGIPPHDILQEFPKIEIWREMGVLLPHGFVERAFLSGKVEWNPHNP